MSQLLCSIFAIALALSFWTNPVDCDAPADVVTIAILAPTPEDPKCKCDAQITAAQGTNTIIACPGGVPGSIFVRSEGTPGLCADVGETSCEPIANNTCAFEVTAKLIWPVGCCAFAAMTGPGIGDDSNPCQVSNNTDTGIVVTWNETASCAEANGFPSPPPKAFKVFCGQTTCPSGVAPSGSYEPVFTCKACARQDP